MEISLLTASSRPPRQSACFKNSSKTGVFNREWALIRETEVDTFQEEFFFGCDYVINAVPRDTPMLNN